MIRMNKSQTQEALEKMSIKILKKQDLELAALDRKIMKHGVDRSL